VTDRTRRWRGWGAGLLAAASLAGFAGTQAAALPSPTIGIKDFQYAPAMLTVPVGTTITWINHDEEPHTVTSATGAFASAGLLTEDTFAQRFTTPGTYQYACALHPHMKATVVVR
jgi:plastocyanin